MIFILITLIVLILILISLMKSTAGNSTPTVDTPDFTEIAMTSNFKEFPMTEEQVVTKIEEIKSVSTNDPVKTKVALVSISTGDRYFSKITKNRLYEYAKLHDYDIEYFEEILDSNYTIMWQKPLAVLEILNKKENGKYKYDVVVWIDDDMYITNTSYGIEDFIRLSSKDILLSRDIINEDYNLYINAGIYIVKNTDIGRKYIQDILNGYDKFNGYFKNEYFHEQSMMTYLFYKEYYDNIDILPYGVLQSFYYKEKVFKNIPTSRLWKSGDFIIHFAGVKLSERNEVIPKLVGKDNYIEKNEKLYPVTVENWKNK